MTHRPLAFLVAASVLARVASAVAFTGCVPLTGLPIGALPTAPTTTAAACIALCPGATYAFWDAATLGCYCSGLPPYNYNQITSSSQTCTGSAYASYDLPTTFTLSGCYTSVQVQSSDSGAPTGTVGGPDTCFQQCKSYIYAIYYPNGGSGTTYNCWCANSAPTLTGGGNCGASKYFVNSHSAAAAASHHARRGKIAARQAHQLALAASPHCPPGFDACQISPNPDVGYECLTTQNELESCGGCRYGIYGNTNGTAPIGVDCTSLPGVNPKGVTCKEGKCVSKNCRRDFKLVNGDCV